MTDEQMGRALRGVGFGWNAVLAAYFVGRALQGETWCLFVAIVGGSMAGLLLFTIAAPETVRIAKPESA